MANSILSRMNGSNNTSNIAGNNNADFSNFREFKLNFNGNPKNHVMQMLNSGQISESQLRQAMQQAQQIQRMYPNIV